MNTNFFNFFYFINFLKSDYLNAEYLLKELSQFSTKTEDDSSALPTNPFELVK